MPGPPGRSVSGAIAYVLAFVASAWLVRACFAELRSPPSSPPSTVTTAAPVTPTTWEELDLGDLAVSLPGTPSEDTKTETVPGVGSATSHIFHLKEGDEGSFEVRATDLHSVVGCNTQGAVDGAVNGAMNGVRSTDGVKALVVVKDERRSLAGMPGRESTAEVTGTQRSAKPFTVRVAVFGRGCRVYQIFAATSGDLSSEVDRMFASVRVTDAGAAAQRKVTAAPTQKRQPSPATSTDGTKRAPVLYGDPGSIPTGGMWNTAQ